MVTPQPLLMVAEQVASACPPADVDTVLSQPSLGWLAPLLRLAADAGEAAGLVVLGDTTPPAAARAHDVTTGDVHHRGDEIELPFEWRTSAYRVLFCRLTGTLTARPGQPAGVVLAVEGSCTLPSEMSGRPTGVLAARRAAEAAVRSLLVQLRTALEHGPPTTSADAPSETGHAALGERAAVPPT